MTDSSAPAAGLVAPRPLHAPGLAPGVLDRYLAVVSGHGGSDLLLAAGSPPMVRVDGELRALEGEQVLTPDSAAALVGAFLGAELAGQLFDRGDVDFAFGWGASDRFRGNAFLQRGAPAVALRRLPVRVPTPGEIGLPNVVGAFAQAPHGLVLVTGPTGSGKTTTLAAIIGHIAERRSVHILTIEDPIEYEFPHRRAAVTQRQVGVDTPSFADALRAALREDPDVLLVGEMRDLESIATALTLAETGHLVFATLHTNDTGQALDRLVDAFPADRQRLVRLQVAATLRGVIAQRLVPRRDGGRVAAFEVLVATPAVRTTVRDGRSEELRNLIATGASSGMQTMEGALRVLVDAGVVDLDAAAAATAHPAELT